MGKTWNKQWQDITTVLLPIINEKGLYSELWIGSNQTKNLVNLELEYVQLKILL